MIEPLWAWTQWSLQNHLFENAVFLAERVCAESACDESKLLLATCHHAAGAANRAVEVLKGCTAPQNRYLLALCCMRLGRLPEAQTALLGPSAGPDTEANAALPNGAAGLYLMGVICLKMQQRHRAIGYLKRALGENPFLWSAYEALSQLGATLPENLTPPPLPTFGGDGAPPMPPLTSASGEMAATAAAAAAASVTPMLPSGGQMLRTPQSASTFTPLNPSAVAFGASSDMVRGTPTLHPPLALFGGPLATRPLALPRRLPRPPRVQLHQSGCRLPRARPSPLTSRAPLAHSGPYRRPTCRRPPPTRHYPRRPLPLWAIGAVPLGRRPRARPWRRTTAAVRSAGACRRTALDGEDGRAAATAALLAAACPRAARRGTRRAPEGWTRATTCRHQRCLARPVVPAATARTRRWGCCVSSRAATVRSACTSARKR